MRKKWYGAAMAWLLVLSMTACGSSGGGGSATTTTATGTEAPATEAEKADGAEAKDAGAAENAQTGEAGDVSTVEGWGAQVKEQLDGTKIVVSMASHPSTEAFQAMADEFTELTGIQEIGRASCRERVS